MKKFVGLAIILLFFSLLLPPAKAEEILTWEDWGEGTGRGRGGDGRGGDGSIFSGWLGCFGTVISEQNL